MDGSRAMRRATWRWRWPRRRNWLDWAWFGLLGVQLPMGDLRFAPSDLVLLIRSGRAGRWRLSRRSLSLAHVALPVLFLVASFRVLREGRPDDIRYVVINKDIGLLVLIASYLLVVHRLLSAPGPKVVLRTFVVGAAVLNAIGLAAWAARVGAGVVVPHIDFVGNRLAGMLVDPNAYGGYVHTAFFLSLPFVLDQPQRRRSRRRHLAVALSLALGVAATFSRSAWVAFALGLLVLGVLRRRVGVRLALAVVLVGAAVWVATPEPLREGFTSLATRYDASVEPRIQQVEAAWSLFLDRPFTGVGLGMFRAESGLPNIIHNTYLWVLTELGVVGAVALLWLLFRYVRILVRLSRYPWSQQTLAQGTLAAFTGMLVFGLGIEMLYQRHFWMLMGVAEGLRYRYRREMAWQEAGPEDAGEGPAPGRAVGERIPAIAG